MSIRKVAIIGAGALGRVVLDVFDAVNAVETAYDILGFIADTEYGSVGTMVNDHPVLGGLEWLAAHRDEVEAICAVGEPRFRYDLVQRARDLGVRFCSIAHPKAMLSRWASVGEGTHAAQGSIVLNQARIGNHVVISPATVIAEDVVIGDYTFLAIGVNVAGKCIVGEGSYLGTGANVIDRIRIGAWSIVGAGAVVIRDVPENTTVVGNPARVISTRPDFWYLE